MTIANSVKIPLTYKQQKNFEFAMANVSDCMSRLTAGGSLIRPYINRTVRTCVTIKTRPGDNLMLHKAIDLAEPGDIIICDAGGDLTNSLMGELCCLMH